MPEPTNTGGTVDGAAGGTGGPEAGAEGAGGAQEKTGAAGAEQKGLLHPEAEAKAGEAKAGEKKDGDKPEGDQAGKSKDGDAAGPPEEYQFDLPEGVEADPDLQSSASATFKEMGLTQEQASKLMEVYNAAQAKQVETWKTRISEWQDTVQKDPILGDAGNLRMAQGFINRLGSPELVAFLDETGFGNHPEIVRLAFEGAKAIGEDKLAGTLKAGAPAPKSRAEILYGKVDKPGGESTG